MYITPHIYIHIYNVRTMNAIWQDNKYPSARFISHINKPVVIKFLSCVLTKLGRASSYL